MFVLLFVFIYFYLNLGKKAAKIFALLFRSANANAKKINNNNKKKYF